MSLQPSTTLFTPKLLVFKNGDTSSILNSKEISFDPLAPLSKVLLDAQKAHAMPFKAKQLFTMAGVPIRGADDLSDGMEVVVGCGEPFKTSSPAGLASPFRPESPLSGRSTPTGYSHSPSPSPVPYSPSPQPGYYASSASPIPTYSASPSPISSSNTPTPTSASNVQESSTPVFSHAAPPVLTHATAPALPSSLSTSSQQGLRSEYSTPTLTPSSSQASIHSATTPREPDSTAISPRSSASSPHPYTYESPRLPPSSLNDGGQRTYISTPAESSSPIPISTTDSPSPAVDSPSLSMTPPQPHTWVLGEGEGRGGGTKERIGSHHESEHKVRAVRTPTHTLIHSTASHTPIYWVWGEGEGKGGGTKERIGNRSLGGQSGSESSESESSESEIASPTITRAGSDTEPSRRSRAWTHGEGEGRGGATKEKIGQRKNRRSEWILGEGEGRGKGTKERIGSRSPMASPPPTHAPASRVAPHWYRREWILGEGEGRGGAMNGKIGGERTLGAHPWVLGEGEGRGGATKDRIGSRARASSTSAAFPARPQRHFSASLLDGWVWGQGEGRGGATKEKIGTRVSPLPPRRRDTYWVWGEGEGRGGATKERIGSRVPLSPTMSNHSWVVGEGEGRGGGTKERIGKTRGHTRSTSNPTTPPVDSFNGWVWGEGEGRGGATKDKIGTEREQKRISPRKRSNTISSSESTSNHYTSVSGGWVWGEGEGNGGGTKERIGDRFAFRRNWVWGEGEGKGGGTKERIGERTREERLFQFFPHYSAREEGGGEDELPSPSSSPSLSPASSPPNLRHHAQLPILPLSSLSSPSPSANASARSKSARSSSSPSPYIPSSPTGKSSARSSARSPSPSLADSPKRKPRSQSSIASSRNSSSPPSPSQSPTPPRSPTLSSRSNSTVSMGARSPSSSRPASQTSQASHVSSNKPRSQSMGPVSTPTPSSPTLSRASTRTAPHSPTSSRARATPTQSVGYQIVKEDWLARVMEGLAQSGVQGVSEDNERFGNEVRDVAREHVTRMRSSVGPSQDAVSFQCSIAVVGPPKSGKTSLLHSLARELGYELAAAEHWKRTFVFPVCWSSLLATSSDLLSLYNKVIARSLLMIPLVQVVPNLSTKLSSFFGNLLSQPHLPRIPTEFSEALPDQVWSLKLLGESVQKAWHNGTPDAFAQAIARLPVSISSVFDYSQVLFVYDDLDSAQVLLGRGTHSQSVGVGYGSKMEKRFLTHLKAVIINHMYLLSGVATKTLLKALADPPVDIASTLDAVSTLDILPPAVFLAKYPECDIDLVIQGGNSEITLNLEYFGGAPGYLAKLVDLVHSHRKRVEGTSVNESDAVRSERERMEELQVYQLAKALSSAPMWVKSAQSNNFSLDSSLSARFLPRSASSSSPSSL